MENIKNISDRAYNYKWIVAKEVEGDLWFEGAWNHYENACESAYRVNGIVFRNPEVE